MCTFTQMVDDPYRQCAGRWTERMKKKNDLPGEVLASEFTQADAGNAYGEDY